MHTALKRPGRQLFACLALLFSLLLCFAAGQLTETTPTMSVPLSDRDLRQYLEGYGWQLSSSPASIDQVLLPEVFGPAYEEYLTCQRECGFRLEELAGQTVLRYTYAVTNYPDGSASVYADLLISGDRVVGGDIRSAALDGFMHSLKYPDSDI